MTKKDTAFIGIQSLVCGHSQGNLFIDIWTCIKKSGYMCMWRSIDHEIKDRERRTVTQWRTKREWMSSIQASLSCPYLVLYLSVFTDSSSCSLRNRMWTTKRTSGREAIMLRKIESFCSEKQWMCTSPGSPPSATHTEALLTFCLPLFPFPICNKKIDPVPKTWLPIFSKY